MNDNDCVLGKATQGDSIIKESRWPESSGVRCAREVSGRRERKDPGEITERR